MLGVVDEGVVGGGVRAGGRSGGDFGRGQRGERAAVPGVGVLSGQGAEGHGGVAVVQLPGGVLRLGARRLGGCLSGGGRVQPQREAFRVGAAGGGQVPQQRGRVQRAVGVVGERPGPQAAQAYPPGVLRQAAGAQAALVALQRDQVHPVAAGGAREAVRGQNRELALGQDLAVVPALRRGAHVAHVGEVEHLVLAGYDGGEDGGGHVDGAAFAGVVDREVLVAVVQHRADGAGFRRGAQFADGAGGELPQGGRVVVDLTGSEHQQRQPRLERLLAGAQQFALPRQDGPVEGDVRQDLGVAAGGAGGGENGLDGRGVEGELRGVDPVAVHDDGQGSAVVDGYAVDGQFLLDGDGVDAGDRVRLEAVVEGDVQVGGGGHGGHLAAVVASIGGSVKVVPARTA